MIHVAEIFTDLCLKQRMPSRKWIVIRGFDKSLYISELQKLFAETESSLC